MRMLGESVIFALSQLRGNRFRTLLSLFGVSIGIFSIVAVFTAIDALQENVRKGFEAFGSDIIMIAKWPMVPEETDATDPSNIYPWWDI